MYPKEARERIEQGASGEAQALLLAKFHELDGQFLAKVRELRDAEADEEDSTKRRELREEQQRIADGFHSSLQLLVEEAGV